MNPERYARQLRLAHLGEAGQRRLAEARVLVVGCGALGSAAAERLARAGVGRLRLIDPDVLSVSNQPRQTLLPDADLGRSKAIALAARLMGVSANLSVEAAPVAFGVGAAWTLDGVDAVVDGTDNLAVRLVLNDACAARGLPLVYGGVTAATGMVMTIRPGVGPCLRCLLPEAPAPSVLAEPHQVGTLGPLPSVIGALQAIEMIKLLVSPADASAGLLVMDAWSGEVERLAVAADPECPTCGKPTA